MQFTVTKQPKSSVKIDFELSVEDMKPHLEKAAEELSTEHKIEGFRPGKASLGIVMQRLGALPVWQEAAEHAVRWAFVDVIKKENIPSIGSPKISLTKLAPDNPLTFTAEVATLPEVTVGDYEKFKAKPATVEVKDEEVNKAMEDLRNMFAKDEPADRPAQEGDKVEVDFDIFVDHVLMENGSSKQHPVVIGSGNFLPEFEKNLVGMKKDEVKEFPVTFPKDYHHKDVAGKVAQFKVTMKAIFQVNKPELNDAFAAQAGKFTTLDELKNKIRENLKAEMDQAEDRKFETAIVNELVNRSKFGELPDVLVDSEIDKMINEMKEQVMMQGGMPFEEYLKGLQKSEEDLRKEFRQPAEVRVKSALVLRHITNLEKVAVSEEDIEKEVAQTMAQYPNDNTIKERLDTQDFRDYIRHVHTNRAVIEMLKGRAKAS